MTTFKRNPSEGYKPSRDGHRYYAEEGEPVELNIKSIGRNHDPKAKFETLIETSEQTGNRYIILYFGAPIEENKGRLGFKSKGRTKLANVSIFENTQAETFNELYTYLKNIEEAVEKHNMSINEALAANKMPIVYPIKSAVMYTEQDFYIIDSEGNKQTQFDGKTPATTNRSTFHLLPEESFELAYEARLRSRTRNNLWVEKTPNSDEQTDDEIVDTSDKSVPNNDKQKPSENK